MVLKDVVRLMQSEESYRFGKLVIDGKSLQCIVKELQCEPKTGLPIHVGFLNLHDAKRVTTFLAIKPTGTSSGVKRGGVLNLAVPELEVVVTNTALLDTLPDHIEVDISKVDIGGVFHLSDLQLPSGVVPANAARDNTILSVVAPAGIGNDSEGSSSDDASASSAA
jgi:large subunit ribosomal protein L25